VAWPTLSQFVIAGEKRSPVLSEFMVRPHHHVFRQCKDQYSARRISGARLQCCLDDLIQRTIFRFGEWESDKLDRSRAGRCFCSNGRNLTASGN
jgi:hypothetical protein